MPRYNITLFYPNGSSSHHLVTTNVYKARARCAQIFQDYDLRGSQSFTGSLWQACSF
jgi:hypothetical protein